MIYAQHNFFENFKSAEGRNDEFMKEQILIDEVAKSILVNKREIVQILRNEGINATHNDTPERILEYLLDQIRRNPEFTKKVSKLIITSNSTELGANGFQNASDEEIASISKGVSSLGGLAGSVKGHADARKQKKKNKKAEQQLKERLKIAQSKKGSVKKMPSWAKWTLIGLGVAVVIGGIIIVIKKSRSGSGGGTSTSPVSVSDSSGGSSDYVPEQ